MKNALKVLNQALKKQSWLFILLLLMFLSFKSKIQASSGDKRIYGVNIVKCFGWR